MKYIIETYENDPEHGGSKFYGYFMGFLEKDKKEIQPIIDWVSGVDTPVWVDKKTSAYEFYLYSDAIRFRQELLIDYEWISENIIREI